MTKKYLDYDIPRRTIKDRVLSQRPSALIIEGLLVLVALVVTIGFLSPAAPVQDNSDAVIAELEAIIAAQESALEEAAEAMAQAAEMTALPAGFLNASAAKNMAWSSLSNEEYRSAIALYDMLIAQGEADVDTYFARGYAYSMIDEHGLAAQDYSVVLDAQAEALGALNNRCWALSEIGAFEAALADCDLLMTLDPEADYPYLNRGIVYEKMGDMTAAMDDYVEWTKRKKRRVIRNDNLAWEGAIELQMAEGLVYVMPFKASAGQDIVVSAVSVQRDLDADPLLLILDPQGDPLIANDDTGEWWDSLVGFRAPVSGEYAVVLTHAGGSVDGRVEVTFDIAGTFTQGNDSANFKSQAYRALNAGDYQTALQNFRQALDLNRNDAEAMNWLGVTYRYLGEYEASIIHIGMAMRLDESYSLPYLSRGITYEQMGESEASAADYYRYAMLNRSRSLAHAELTGDSKFELPMREGWVYSIPFDAKRGQKLNIDVSTVAPGFVDPLIILIGPEGQAMTGDDDISRSDYDATISDYKLPASGEYTLIVSHAEGGANGTIQVEVDLATPAPMSIPGYDGCSEGMGR